MEESAQVIELKKQIVALQEKLSQVQLTEYGLFADDLYEYLLIARTQAMNDKVSDAISCTNDAYRRLTEKDETIKRILEFFPGKTTNQRKDSLRDFLRENPAFRTKNPELLLQRLRLHRKYADTFSKEQIPLQPIKEAIDRSNTPLPIPEPKDEDFLV